MLFSVTIVKLVAQEQKVEKRQLRDGMPVRGKNIMTKIFAPHIKIHILNNPETKKLMGKGKMSVEIFEKVRMDTGISRDVHVAFLGGPDNVYVIEGHKSTDDLFNLLKREDLPEDLRSTLIVSLMKSDFKETYQWE